MTCECLEILFRAELSRVVARKIAATKAVRKLSTGYSISGWPGVMPARRRYGRRTIKRLSMYDGPEEGGTPGTSDRSRPNAARAEAPANGARAKSPASRLRRPLL